MCSAAGRSAWAGHAAEDGRVRLACAATAAHRHSLRPCRTDHGLRLLVHLADMRQVRWSTDPDAPAARCLRAGEARLVLRRALLQGPERLAAAPVQPPADPFVARPWAGVPVEGLMVVVESRAAAWPVGLQLVLSTTLRTHQVVTEAMPGVAGHPGPAPARACPATRPTENADAQHTATESLLRGAEIARGREPIEHVWRERCDRALSLGWLAHLDACQNRSDVQASSPPGREPILVSPWTRIRTSAARLHPSLTSR